MKQKIILKLLLISILCTLARNSCPGFYQGDLLQSGKYAIIRRQTSSPQYQYEALVSFPIPVQGLQIAVTTSSIASNPSTNQGLNYIIEARRKGSLNSIIFRLISSNSNSNYQDQAWNSIQLSYLFSARPDMAVGNFQVVSSAWGAGNGGVYHVSYPIAKGLVRQAYRVGVFISGFSTTDPQYRLAVNKRFYDVDQKKIVIGFYCVANPAILSVTFTYIVYPEIHPNLDFYYETTPQGQTGSYQISGPVSFQSNRLIQYNEWRVGKRLLACTGNQCASQGCILREHCLQNYGNLWQGQCIFCSPGVIFQYGRCSRKCGANQVYVNRACTCSRGFTRNGKDCVRANVCGTNQIYDQANGCICREGCSNFYGQCKQCPPGSAPTSDRKSCYCNDLYKIYDPITHTCNNRCNKNQIWQNNRCSCLAKHCWWNQQCRLCPPNSQPSPDQTTCVCRGNSASYNPWDNTCIECPTNMVLTQDGKTCICPQGYRLSGTACIPTQQITCKNNQIFNPATRYCDCKPGLQRIINQCRPQRQTQRCQIDQQWDGYKCGCAIGYARYQQTCRKCPAGTLPNSIRTSCICINQNQIFVPQRFACASCPPNSVPNSNLTGCICRPGFTVSRNTCVLKCSKNQIANQITGRCQCSYGLYKPDINGRCVPRCQNNQQWNGNKCVCQAGCGLNNGICQVCPKDTFANAARTSCTCIAPNYVFDTKTFRCILCPANSYRSEDNSCVCNQGYNPVNNRCVPVCGLEEQLDINTNKCQCKYGFTRLGRNCIRKCPDTQQWTNAGCICQAGFVNVNNRCIQCPRDSITNPSRTACICQNNRYFNRQKFQCQLCPDNSYPNSDYTDFICQTGYQRQTNSCISICPPGTAPTKTGQCQCTGGLVLQGNTCRKPIQCPHNSEWNQNTLECVCLIKGEFLLNGVCQRCGENSLYSRTVKACVCNTGFFSIGNVCTVCDARSRYNGTDCVCNLGHYGNRDKCHQCHPTCSRCTGPQSNQCQSCSDISLALQDGYCKKDTPCPPGYYLDGTCAKCADNCIFCQNLLKCDACAIGYKLQKVRIDNEVIDVCVEICGDGIRYQLECDDGNVVDGDGCSRNCTVEEKWTCQGGSSNKKSACNKFIPDQTILSSKGAVNLGDRVLLSVRASYLPTCLTKQQCTKCFKVLKVNIVDSNVPVLVKVKFIPFSQYQFLIQYDFQGLIVTSRFKTVIKLNEQFKGCLADDDYHQQLELEVDPAFLAKVDTNDQLSLDQVEGNGNGGNGKGDIKVPAAANAILGLGK